MRTVIVAGADRLKAAMKFRFSSVLHETLAEPGSAALESRSERFDELVGAIRSETDRGTACVVDAVLDELFKELLLSRLVAGSEAKDFTGMSQALGPHGVRLKLVYLLGWIGPTTYADCRTIHKVRNLMAHNLDVNSFEHGHKDLALIDVLHASMPLEGATRRDRFVMAALYATVRLWSLIAESKQPTPVADIPIVVAIEPFDGELGYDLRVQ